MRILAIILVLFMAKSAILQIQVTPNLPARTLAEEIIGTTGYIKSAILNCPQDGSGSFISGDILSSGIVLTTGKAKDSEGPNDRNNTSTNHGVSGDSDLDALAGSFPTLDACVLEFEVIPYCDKLSFTFQFASEEYNEYVGRAFNDVFGIFVTGPNPNASLPNYNKLNLAEIGGVTINVNSINSTTNNAYFLNNTTNNNEYDGMTIAITKEVSVIPCATYKIKLGVADGFDGIYDAAVFVRTKDTACSPYPVYTVKSRTLKVHEGCFDTLFFERSMVGFPDTIPLSYSGPAGNTTDVPVLPPKLIFPINDSIGYIVISPSSDYIYEGQEKLTITYPVGNCNIIDTADVRIEDQINVSAGPDFNICTGNSAQLQGFCPVLPDITYSWSPTFGLNNPNILKPTVTLTSTDTVIETYSYFFTAVYRGCVYTDTVNVFVVPKPQVRFNYFANCDYDSTLLVSTSTSPLPLTNNWNFGDGYSGTGNPVYHVFNLGTYRVKLTVVNSLGCFDTLTKVIDINPSPNTDFTFQNGCQGQEVCFNNTTTINPGASVAINRWTIDGTNTNILNPCYTFLYSGSYNIKLYTESDRGCKDSITKVLRIFNKPIANFSAYNDCEQDSVEFNNYSTVTGSVISKNYWDFGDGGIDSVKNPIYIYPTSGNYNVQLIARSQDGCNDTIVKPITIFPKPNANFQSSTGVLCEYSCVDFVNLSQANASSFVFTQWRFGDQFFLNQFDASHCYEDSGHYDVTLIVKNSYGCIDSIKKKNEIKVYPSPTAKFGLNKIYLDDYTEPLLISDSSFYGITNYLWNFGDGTTDTNYYAGPFSHQFPKTGQYRITLTVRNEFGCESDYFDVIYYRKDGEILYVPNAFTPDDDGENDVFGVRGSFLEDIENFEFIIFNRWGNQVFHTYYPSDNWDGFENGTPAKEDVYVWQLTYTLNGDETKKRFGTVTLIK